MKLKRSLRVSCFFAQNLKFTFNDICEPTFTASELNLNYACALYQICMCLCPGAYDVTVSVH